MTGVASLPFQFSSMPHFTESEYETLDTTAQDDTMDPFSTAMHHPGGFNAGMGDFGTLFPMSSTFPTTSSVYTTTPAAHFAQPPYTAGLGMNNILSSFALPMQPTFTEVTERTSSTVDPSLIANPAAAAIPYTGYTFGAVPAVVPSPHAIYAQPPSPALSNQSSHSQSFHDARKVRGSQSPRLPGGNYAFHPYAQAFASSRRPSQISLHDPQAFPSPGGSGNYDLENPEQQGQCPFPDCGKVFKDLKAHLLTHQHERPEKCPITTCEYHLKGFARKYDKNRHTLTHYKGTMVCGFCPAPGSPDEKSFNRADVFKRHLTSVHGVEQTPPNSRKRLTSSRKGAASAGGADGSKTGLCSTCNTVFANVQEFYEHLDECVLRVVQQTDPFEATNKMNLDTVEHDEQVQQTLERHNLPLQVDEFLSDAPYGDDAEEDEDSDTFLDNVSTALNTAVNAGAGMPPAQPQQRSLKSGKGGIRSRRDGNGDGS